MTAASTVDRCPWCGQDPLYVAYHDQEWGVPEHDGRALYEKLILDGFQAGLSWITILRKRAAFRAAFEGFEPARIAQWGEPEVARLLQNPGIVRHRGKIEGAIKGARAWEKIEAREGFSHFLWKFVEGRPIRNEFRSMSEVPTATAESTALAKALKAEGFVFCGPVIVYAAMQAMGLVNDHMVDCPRHAACAALA
ncbi:DNA-3-methyladenine glycosylase I [Neomegalonema sp.]|uniref:DNA-3-methyladenine glycosylase I n=1 Tax=Neomegalonema sp. TaxID=2039713 RepID=UPI00262DC852|nr:DNA-3-methyladenine glycosylase I [Neomegalonema sp.]MDD2867625.1 DNA-3-methyladenine glycosylase I [Neomegalonema sp.]